jgi:hypothetical protein
LTNGRFNLTITVQFDWGIKSTNTDLKSGERRVKDEESNRICSRVIIYGWIGDRSGGDHRIKICPFHVTQAHPAPKIL